MPGNLFSKQPEYTIDSSCLMDIFGDSSWKSKSINAGLWKKVEELIKEGVIISHIEVLGEIKKDGVRGEQLYNWAQENKSSFWEHNIKEEGEVIRAMSGQYKAFVDNRVGDVYADPWLIAQAKTRGLTIITEEKASASSNMAKARIPNVCRDPLFNVRCIDLFELCKERGWVFGV